MVPAVALILPMLFFLLGDARAEYDEPLAKNKMLPLSAVAYSPDVKACMANMLAGVKICASDAAGR